MIYFSQHNPVYKKIKLGTCRNTIWQSGCKLCSLAMLTYNDPIKLNEYLIDNNLYTRGCLIDDAKVSKALGIKFGGRTVKKPKFICMAETNHFAPKVPQHFFVFAPKGTVSEVSDLMLDPLDNYKTMSWQPVKYKVKSYRLFHEKKLWSFSSKPVEDKEMKAALAWNKSYNPKPIINKVMHKTKTDAELLLMLYRFKKGL